MAADEGTAAVLERDDAPVEADNASEELTEAVAEELATESETLEEETDSDTESEEEPPVTKADLDKALKDQKARLEESYRQKEQAAVSKANEDAYRLQLSQAESVVSGQTFQYLASLAQDMQTVLRSGDEINPQGLSQRLNLIAQEVSRAHAIRVNDAQYKTFLKKLGDFKPEAEMVSKYERAIQARDPIASLDALMELVEAKSYATAEAKFEENRKKAAETAKTVEGAKAASRAQRPTSGTPASNGKPLTLAQIEAMSMREWDAIGASDKDGGTARRARILAQAHERVG